MTQPLRRGRRIAQEAQVFALLAEMLLQLAPVEQAHIRVLALPQPLQGGRQDDAVDLGGPRDAVGQGLHMALRRVRILEADRGEAVAHRAVGQPDLLVVQSRADRQHRPVVDVQMEPAHLAARLVECGDELLGVHAEGAGEPAQLAVAAELVHIGLALALQPADAGGPQIREQVGAFQGPHLLAVLHHALEAVVPGQAHGLLAGDVAAVGERLQRFERGPGAQRLVGAPVHQLEHLHGELHIAQPSAPKLDLTVLERRGDQILHAPAHLLAVVDEIVPLGRLPHERAGHVHIRLSELRVARRRAGLEQRLELPVLRPLLVVGLMGIQTAHQRAVLAFGPQTAVDLPERRFGDAHDYGLADALQRGGHLGADAGERHAVGAVGRLDHVDQVHVGNVVELLRAQLAHADDGEAATLAAGHLMTGYGQRPFERRVGQVRKHAADARLLADRVGRGHVLGHDGGQLLVVCGAQPRGGLRQIQRGGGGRCIRGIGSHRVQDMLAAPGAVEVAAAAAVDRHGLHQIRTGAHHLAHRIRGPEHRHQARERRFVGQRVAQPPVTVGLRVHDLNQIGQRRVRVAGAFQHAQRQRQLVRGHAPVRQLAERPPGLVEVLQPRMDEFPDADGEILPCFHISNVHAAASSCVAVTARRTAQNSPWTFCQMRRVTPGWFMVYRWMPSTPRATRSAICSEA